VGTAGPLMPTNMCSTCGHDRPSHDYYHGCLVFLCCDRRQNTFPGKRHMEHDGINHKAQPCACEQFTEMGAA
jgi:hypothetical protein